mmetsp:Transcript_40467/g.115739  ORF Transcript_40467/g.115739 Transcript_40467/m.115739 type:complete len:254 (+) Transcript_40467:657-1418(+)
MQLHRLNGIGLLVIGQQRLALCSRNTGLPLCAAGARARGGRRRALRVRGAAAAAGGAVAADAVVASIQTLERIKCIRQVRKPCTTHQVATDLLRTDGELSAEEVLQSLQVFQGRIHFPTLVDRVHGPRTAAHELTQVATALPPVHGHEAADGRVESRGDVLHGQRGSAEDRASAVHVDVLAADAHDQEVMDAKPALQPVGSHREGVQAEPVRGRTSLVNPSRRRSTRCGIRSLRQHQLEGQLVLEFHVVELLP